MDSATSVHQRTELARDLDALAERVVFSTCPERLYVVEAGATLNGRAFAWDADRHAVIVLSEHDVPAAHRWPVVGLVVRVIVSTLPGLRLRSLVAVLLSAGAASVRAMRVSGNRIEWCPGIDALAGDVR